MRNPQRDPEEEEFAAHVAKGMKDLRDERGPCPSSQTLVNFHHGDLAPQESALVQDHVAACGLCDVALTRLQQAEPGFVEHRKRFRDRVKIFLCNPALAYGLLVLLCYPAFLSIKQWRPNNPSVRGMAPGPPMAPSPSRPIAESPPVFELAQTRGAAARIHLGSGEASFILKFFAPLQPGIIYSGVIKNDAGLPIQVLSKLAAQDALGNVLLVCSQAAFLPGRYTLTVVETSTRHQVLQCTFEVE